MEVGGNILPICIQTWNSSMYVCLFIFKNKNFYRTSGSDSNVCMFIYMYFCNGFN